VGGSGAAREKTTPDNSLFAHIPGHAAKTWDDPDIYLMFYEAMKWSLALTEADITPQPMPAAVAK